VTAAALQDKYWQAFQTSARKKLENMTEKQREEVKTLVTTDLKAIVSATCFIAKNLGADKKKGAVGT
jgi:hypothetical protein